MTQYFGTDKLVCEELQKEFITLRVLVLDKQMNLDTEFSAAEFSVTYEKLN